MYLLVLWVKIDQQGISPSVWNRDMGTRIKFRHTSKSPILQRDKWQIQVDQNTTYKIVLLDINVYIAKSGKKVKI